MQILNEQANKDLAISYIKDLYINKKFISNNISFILNQDKNINKSHLEILMINHEDKSDYLYNFLSEEETSPLILEALYDIDSIRIKKSIARNKTTPPYILRRLFNLLGTFISNEILSNTSSPIDLILDILNKDLYFHTEMLRALLQRESLIITKSILDYAVKYNIIQILLIIARANYIDDEIFNKLYNLNLEDVNSVLILNKKTPIHILINFINSEDRNMLLYSKYHLLNNNDIPFEYHYKLLIKLEGFEKEYKCVNRKDVPVDFLIKYFDCEEVQCHIASNHNTPTYILEKIFDIILNNLSSKENFHFSKGILIFDCILQNKNLSKNLIKKLLLSNNKIIKKILYDSIKKGSIHLDNKYKILL